MLVFGVAVECIDWQLQDVSGRRRAVRHTPALAVEEERRLRLRPGEAELPNIARNAPSRLIFSQGTQAFGNIGLGQPVNMLAVIPEHLIDPLRTQQLNGTGAILADSAD